MKPIHPSEILAERLVKQPIFRKTSRHTLWGAGDYHLFTDVPAHSLSVEGSGSDCGQDFPYQVIDLLICRGKEAVLAILIDSDKEAERMFSTCLAAVPRLFLQSEAMIEDAVRDLCGEIQFRLRSDRADPLHTGCMVYPLFLLNVIAKMKEPAIDEKLTRGLPPFLQEKHLLQSDGHISGYGRACGLFRYHSAAGRSLFVTVPSAAQLLKQAMLWRDSSGGKLPLAKQLERLAQGYPSSGSGHGAARLKKLLDAPLESLFRNYPQDAQRLNALLNHAQFLSQESAVSAFGDREEIVTYGDGIRAVRNLLESTAQGADINALCEQILAYLSFPLWSLPPEEKGTPEKSRSLRARILGTDSGVYDLELARMPLGHYFHAAACLTESEYPLWLYRTLIKPQLAQYASGELSFARAMILVYKLSWSEDEQEAADYFLLLYDILAEPILGLL